MKEKPKNNFEEKTEFIPTLKDIQFVFEELLEIKEYETLRKLEDEQGLLELWEIKIPEEDGHREYLYIKGEDPDAIVFTIFVNRDGVPMKGCSVAKHIDGEWKLTS